jgi:hypothetical protein
MDDKAKIDMPVINYRFISIDEECEKDVIPSSCTFPRSYSWVRRDSGTWLRSTDPRCFSLLDEFYVDLMIPAFPLEGERDDIHDWLTYFREQMIERQRQRAATATKMVEAAAEEGTTTTSEDDEIVGGINKLDIILMIHDLNDDNDDATKRNNDEKYVFEKCSNTSNQQFLLGDMNDAQSRHLVQGSKIKIMGAVTMEYYKNSKVGLIGYIVLHEEYRGRGLGKVLHEEALVRMEMMANKYSGDGGGDTGTFKSPLRAIFAETNTLSAGDISPAQCLERHQTLYKLGYRLIKFPYAQPPLDTKDKNSSFDDIMLLVYFPYNDNESHDSLDNDFELRRQSNRELMMRYCSWFFDEEINDGNNYDHSNGFARMKFDIPFHFVEEFYQITFIHATNLVTDDDDDSEKSSEEEMMIDYHTADYYKLAHWFTRQRQKERDSSKGAVEVSLCPPSTTPWEDCKDILLPEWKEWQEKEEQKNKPQDLMS